MERASECGGDFPNIFLSSGVNANATEFIPAPQQPLRDYDLAYLWHRYCRSNAGSGASRERSERLAHLQKRALEFYNQRLFRPSDTAGASLLSYFRDRARYNSSRYALVGAQSLLARARAPAPASVTSPAPHEDSAPKTPRRSPQEAMASPNKHNQLFLSHQSIVVLQLIKGLCGDGVSDKNFLLLQLLIQYLVSGEPPTEEEARKVCITGEAHGQRARQVLWRLKQDAASKINGSPGVTFSSTDDSDVGGTNMGSRHVYYFDDDSNAPADYALSGTPTARKDAGTGGLALLEAHHGDGISTKKHSGLRHPRRVHIQSAHSPLVPPPSPRSWHRKVPPPLTTSCS